jgi:hypothetical protein
MALEMSGACQRCRAPLQPDGEAYICSFECTFCALCAGDSMMVCPNCGGELLRRPRRAAAACAAADQNEQAAHTPGRSA